MPWVTRKVDSRSIGTSIANYPKLQGGFIWDFVDQSLRWTNSKGRPIWAYGGDFNTTDQHDGNFCDNGLISPDRKPNPHMYEVGYYYQNIWTTLAGKAENGGQNLEILNEYRFRDLSNYRMEWELLCNGEAVSTGTVSQIKAAPQQKALVTIPLDKLDDRAEWLLNVKYVLKRSEPLLKAGSVMAHQQLALTSPVACSYRSNPNNPNTPITLTHNETADQLTIAGPHFVIGFDKRSGLMNRYEANGVKLLAEGAQLKPNFWRAPTDNDFGANLQRKYAAWNNPELKLTSFESRPNLR